ncbi:MAG: hypothetical protein QOG61_539, partial [Candidatus Binataceae bacterium]|nr:hypothetical protein [Candidatus Binataceae bacterium]
MFRDAVTIEEGGRSAVCSKSNPFRYFVKLPTGDAASAESI